MQENGGLAETLALTRIADRSKTRTLSNMRDQASGIKAADGRARQCAVKVKRRNLAGGTGILSVRGTVVLKEEAAACRATIHAPPDLARRRGVVIGPEEKGVAVGCPAVWQLDRRRARLCKMPLA